MMDNDIHNCAQANVISYTFKNASLKWTFKTIKGSRSKVAELSISEITSKVIINGIVMVYASRNAEDHNSWSALPISFFDGDHTIRFSYGIVTSKILLRASKIDISVTPSKDIAFKVVIIQGITEKALHLDLLNYKATMNFLNANRDNGEIS
jgi:hypothetical protein